MPNKSKSQFCGLELTDSDPHFSVPSPADAIDFVYETLRYAYAGSQAVPPDAVTVLDVYIEYGFYIEARLCVNGIMCRAQFLSDSSHNLKVKML